MTRRSLFRALFAAPLAALFGVKATWQSRIRPLFTSPYAPSYGRDGLNKFFSKQSELERAWRKQAIADINFLMGEQWPAPPLGYAEALRHKTAVDYAASVLRESGDDLR